MLFKITKFDEFAFFLDSFCFVRMLLLTMVGFSA